MYEGRGTYMYHISNLLLHPSQLCRPRYLADIKDKMALTIALEQY